MVTPNMNKFLFFTIFGVGLVASYYRSLANKRASQIASLSANVARLTKNKKAQKLYTNGLLLIHQCETNAYTSKLSFLNLKIDHLSKQIYLLELKKADNDEDDWIQSNSLLQPIKGRPLEDSDSLDSDDDEEDPLNLTFEIEGDTLDEDSSEGYGSEDHFESSLDKKTIYKGVDFCYQKFISDLSIDLILVDLEKFSSLHCRSVLNHEDSDLEESDFNSSIMSRSDNFENNDNSNKESDEMLIIVTFALLKLIRNKQLLQNFTKIESLIKKYSPLFSKFIDNAKSQLLLLKHLETACTLDKVLQTHVLLLRAFYKLELVDPDCVLKWFHDDGGDKGVTIRGFSKCFVDWLDKEGQRHTSDSEDEDDDSEDEFHLMTKKIVKRVAVVHNIPKKGVKFIFE